jgi:hypothetical protein
MNPDSPPRSVVVHSVLPSKLAAEVDSVLASAGIAHRQHDIDDPVAAGVVAASDPAAVALIGPFRSRDVAETVEATAPARLALIAPMATWAGVTRDDEPGCEDDPADQQGTVFRLLARDTVVASCIAEDVRRAAQRATVVAGTHEYGMQLDAQLSLARLPRAEQEDPDLVVLCGLIGEPEIERAQALAPLPVVAFDGVQGAALGSGRDVLVALPHAPRDDLTTPDLFAGVGQARQAAELAVSVIRAGGDDRTSFLRALRGLGQFDEHGDLRAPPVWLWRAGPDWSLTPERRLG